MADDGLKELKGLSPKERAKKLKEIMEKKKKEISDIEEMYNKSLSELKESPVEMISEEAKPISLDEAVDENIVQAEKEEEPLENIASLYKRIKSYNELLQEGNMDYKTFTAAMEVYQQMRQETSKVGSIENIYISKKAEEITSIAKRMVEEISGSYLKNVMDYRGPETR